jgi:CRISPR/Cas system-associated endoribonuclease Cas2
MTGIILKIDSKEDNKQDVVNLIKEYMIEIQHNFFIGKLNSRIMEVIKNKIKENRVKAFIFRSSNCSIVGFEREAINGYDLVKEKKTNIWSRR